MTKTKRLMISAIAATGLITLTSGNASAVDYETGYSGDSQYGARATFWTHGDYFIVNDRVKEGKGARLQYRVARYKSSLPNASKVTKDFTRGYTGDSLYRYKWDREIRENRYVQFRVGLVNGGKYVSGSYGPWVTVYNMNQ